VTLAAAAAPRPAAIEASGWGWRHAGRSSWALQGIDLHVDPGERILLLGPSGAGKSTLLLGLAGLLSATGGAESEGRLLLDGRPPVEARDRVAILFQDPDSQLVMGRAGDDVAFGLENRCVPNEAIWPRVDAALDAVGFPYGRERPTTHLSGGEQQRLAIAGMLALRPGLILLDEPTANLDPEGSALVVDLLRRIIERNAPTMVLVEHQLEEVLPLVTRVVALSPNGELMADGDPNWVFSRYAEQLERSGVWLPGHRAPPQPTRSRPPTNTMVFGERVGFSYPDERLPAVGPVEVQVRSSEALAVVGPNGAGKSTLALMLAGLLRPTTGEVQSGEALAAGRGHEAIWRWRARELTGRIGMVFQEPEDQFLTGRVRDELALGPKLLGLPDVEIRNRVGELLDRLHLAHLAAANPFTLSGGEKRRLSVATALATAPSVLILDEPTFGQDSRTWEELLSLLAALRDAGRAICFATHDRDFAKALADRTLHLRLPQGEAVAR
jgi:energy-coupling factor transporter ATP-binding protein EcfA2